MKKYVSLFLAVIIFFSSFGTHAVYAESESVGMSQGRDDMQNMRSLTEEEEEQSEDDPQLEPESDTEAAVNDFTLEYNAAADVMILKYQVNHAVACVDILVDGRPAEVNYSNVYTSYSYDLPDDAEGKKYAFQIIPYEIRNTGGESVKIQGTPSAVKEYEVPYKQAVFTDVDAEYDLNKKYLSMEWFGTGISSVDIYLDGAAEPIAAGVLGNSFSINIDWQPLSKHTYRLVPYNKLGQKGTEKTVELTVDDYEATVDLLDAEYVPQKNQIRINWSGSNVKYVDIYMNDELLVDNYIKEEYSFKYTPQAGASYMITVNPYNENGEEGEEAQDALTEGEFEVPVIDKLRETSSYGTDAEKHYTGFSKPAVNIRWTAQENGCYEIYRASKDARSGYSCIDRVETAKSGPYVYTDSNARIGSNYYKIRQVIKEDDYITQEVSTALSDADEITIKVPKPKVNINLTPEGTVMFSMDGKKEFISGYVILRKNKSGSYKQIAEVTDDAYTDYNTEFGKQYSYRVKSFYYDTRTREKYYSPAVQIRAKNTVGGFAVSAQQTSEENVKIAWEAAANAQGYEVYYKSATAGDSYKPLEVTDQLELNVSLKQGSRYCFMVKAYKENSKKKIYFSTAETELKTGFTKPGNFRVSKTSFQYDKDKKILVRKDKLAWDKVYGAKGYYIDVYNPAKKKFKTVKRIKGMDSTSYEVSNTLTPKTETLIYRIRAYAGQRKAIGEKLEIRMQIGKVTGVSVSRAGDYARVSWKQTKGAELYRIYRSNGRSSTLVGTTDKLKFTDKGLSAGVVYNYYVQAVSNTLKSEGEYSEPVQYKKKLLKVDYLSASNRDRENVELEWMSEEGASGHIIYYREGKSGEYQMLARVNGSRTAYTHKNVTPGATYYYKVSRMEINAGGVETESDTQQVKITVKNAPGNKDGKSSTSKTK